MSATVLIVEDDEMIREVIDATLSMAGFRCVTASSASTAMEVMRRIDAAGVLAGAAMKRTARTVHFLDGSPNCGSLTP